MDHDEELIKKTGTKVRLNPTNRQRKIASKISQNTFD